MSTFATQVAGLVGTVPVAAYLNDWLTAGARYVINILSDEYLIQNAVDLTDTAGSAATFTVTITGDAVTAVAVVGGGTGYPPYCNLTIAGTGTGAKAYAVANASGVITYVYVTAGGSGYTGTPTATVDGSAGVTISGHRIIGAHKLGYDAVYSHASQKTQHGDINSIFYATAKSPVFYMEGDKGYVLPGGGTLKGIPYPTVINTDSTITNFPRNLEPAVVIYAGLQFRMRELSVNRESVEGLTWATPIPPTLPDLPNYYYIDATVGTIASTPVEPLTSAPVYTPPTLSAWPLTVVGAVDLSTIVAPTTPNLPMYSYVDAVVGTITATSIDPLTTAPVYTAPTISGWPTTIVGTIDFSDLTIPTPPDVPLFVYVAPTGQSVDTTLVGLTGTAPVFISPASLVSYAAPVYSLETDEDIEKAGGELNLLQVQLVEYKANLDNAVAKFNEGKVAYDAQVQLAIHQADLLQQRLIAITQTTNDLNEKIAAQTVAIQIQLYQATLERFQANLKQYTDRMDARIKVKQVEVQNLQIDRSTLVQKFQADVESAVASYNQTIAVYTATLQRAIEQAKLDQQRLMAVSQLTTDLNLKNTQQRTAEDIQIYQLVLSKFQSDLKQYTDKIDTILKAKQIEISLFQADRETVLQRYRAEVENAVATYNQTVVTYQTTLQRAVEQARLDQTRLLQVASQTTEVDVKNKLQAVANQVEEYKSILERFAQSMGLFNVIVQAESARYQNEIAKHAESCRELSVGITTLQLELNRFLAPYLPKPSQGENNGQSS